MGVRRTLRLGTANQIEFLNTSSADSLLDSALVDHGDWASKSAFMDGDGPGAASTARANGPCDESKGQPTLRCNIAAEKRLCMRDKSTLARSRAREMTIVVEKNYKLSR